MILIVEDQPVTARVIESNLMRAGHECAIAGHGADALDILRKRNDVSLVITDVEMPSMDGFSLISELRANQQWSKLPIIVVSGHNDIDTVKKAGSLGVRHFVLKPVIPAKLIETVSQLVCDSQPGSS